MPGRLMSRIIYVPYERVTGVVENEVQNMIRRQINYVFSAAVSIFIVTAVLLAACASHTGEELVQATKKGDTETVKRLLEAGVAVNTEDSKHHSSVLMWAAHGRGTYRYYGFVDPKWRKCRYQKAVGRNRLVVRSTKRTPGSPENTRSPWRGC